MCGAGGGAGGPRGGGKRHLQRLWQSRCVVQEQKEHLLRRIPRGRTNGLRGDQEVRKGQIMIRKRDLGFLLKVVERGFEARERSVLARLLPREWLTGGC